MHFGNKKVQITDEQYLLFTDHTRAGGCVVTHSPLKPTARVQHPVALLSSTQAIILL